GEEIRFGSAGARQLLVSLRQQAVQLGALLLDAPPLGVIARHLAEALERAALVVQRGDDHVGPEARAVLAQAPALVLEASVARRDLELVPRLARRHVFFRIEALEGAPEDLVGGPALDALGALVPAADLAARI